MVWRTFEQTWSQLRGNSSTSPVDGMTTSEKIDTKQISRSFHIRLQCHLLSVSEKLWLSELLAASTLYLYQEKVAGAAGAGGAVEHGAGWSFGTPNIGKTWSFPRPHMTWSTSSTLQQLWPGGCWDWSLDTERTSPDWKLSQWIPVERLERLPGCFRELAFQRISSPALEC